MKLNGYKYDQSAKFIDNNNFLKRIQQHYNTTEIKRIEKKLKTDIKNKESFQRLLKELNYSKEEFIFNMACVFRDLFNNSLITYVKGYLSDESTK